MLWSSAEAMLLASSMDQEKHQKASLNNVSYALNNAFLQRRLLQDKSTSNLGCLTKVVVESDDKLFITPRKIEEPS
jgi:hypothetical protein